MASLNDDLIRDIEHDMDALEVEGRRMIAEFSKLIPRPVGTTRASDEDRRFDYVTRGPDYWQAMYEKALKEVVTSGGTEADIELMLRDHDAEMRQGES